MSTLTTIAAVFAIGLVFLASMLWSTEGRPSLPLDDSFIYFQYAKQAAMGQPFVYQPGDAPTTGCTSPLWMFLLAAGALVGFSGKAIIFFAMIGGGLLLAVTVRLAASCERALTSEIAAGLPLAGLLVLLSGPLHWGAWSGMEIALFATVITAAFRVWSENGGRPSKGLALALGGLALVRPEGALLAIVGVGALFGQAVFRSEDRSKLAWTLVPAASAFVQPVLNRLLTGDWRSSGYLAKSLLAAPGAEVVDVARMAVLRAASLGAAVFGNVAPFADGRGLYAYGSESAWMFVAPGAAVLFLIGALPMVARELRERHVGPGGLAIAWIFVLLVATCTLEEPDAHFSRYQMPILPVFLVFVSVGVRRLARALAEAGGGLARFATGLRVWLVGFGAVSVAFFAAAFGDDCEDIDRMQIALGEALATTLEPGTNVAINDAGALAYFSRQRTVDLVGLTTPGFAGMWPQGSAPLWEKLESLPGPERPAWFCVFPNWFDFDDIGLLRRKGGVRLLSPSIVDAEKVLYRADWSFAESGHAPFIVPENAGDLRVVDRVDVADLNSERAHAFVFEDGQRGSSGGTFLSRLPLVDPAYEIVDGGRTIFRKMRFEIARDSVTPAALVLRTVSGARQRILVSVDGGPEVTAEVYAPGPGRFHEQSVATLPPGPGPVRVQIRLVSEVAATAPLIVTHVFCLAGAR